MNVFEDLIEELKEENLLETTVIETHRSESYFDANQTQSNSSIKKEIKPPAEEISSHDQFQNIPLVNNDPALEQLDQEFQGGDPSISDPSTEETTPLVQTSEVSDTFDQEGVVENDDFEVPTESIALNSNNIDLPEFNSEQLVESLKKETLSFSDQVILEEAQLQELQDLAVQPNSNIADKPVAAEANLEQEQPSFPEYELLSKNVVEDSEFYRRRANEEVTSLQIVEHIISAIEKEQMKIVPQSYDDLGVSMALHDFLQAGSNPLSDEHTQAEFKLMQETERWYSTLASRDNNITVGDLRRYTETAKPALSSQALISLARFYRNSPFSETVRSKFDMVITKLVTKDCWDDTRLIVFNRDELVKQLEELYADWSSIPLYENKEEDSDVLIGVLKFDDFIFEVNKADSLNDLVKSDFFNRIRVFKETTGEKFFAPLLAAAAIECNVIVGNKYVQLVAHERETHNDAEIEEKYNFLLDQPVSDTVSKTLKLVELLKEKKEPPKPVVHEALKEIKEELIVQKSSKTINAENEKRHKAPRFRVNKLLVAVVVFAIFSLGGLYTWAEFMTPQMKASPNVRKVDLENTPLREYFNTARINRETYFAVTEPTWEKLSKEVKEDVLKKTLSEGKDKGYTKIHVLDKEGKMVAFASEKGINLDPK